MYGKRRHMAWYDDGKRVIFLRLFILCTTQKCLKSFSSIANRIQGNSTLWLIRKKKNTCKRLSYLPEVELAKLWWWQFRKTIVINKRIPTMLRGRDELY